MELAQDFVNRVPRAVVRSTGVTRQSDLLHCGCAGADHLSISTFLLEHPVFGAIGGLAVPVGRLFRDTT